MVKIDIAQFKPLVIVAALLAIFIIVIIIGRWFKYCFAAFN